jgi:hypothetical protein
MKCYICEKTVRVGGTRYAVAEVVGICHNCGIAVCIEHSSQSPKKAHHCFALSALKSKMPGCI